MWGGRIPHIQAIHGAGGASSYVAKGALGASGYVTKGSAEGTEAYRKHLALNGGRSAHWSRNYFGRPIQDVIEEMYAETFEPTGGTWYVVVRSELNRAECPRTSA